MGDIEALALFVVLVFFVLLVHIAFLTVHIRDVDGEIKELKEKLNQITENNSTQDAGLMNQYQNRRSETKVFLEPTKIKVIFKETNVYFTLSDIVKVIECSVAFTLVTKDNFERTFYKPDYYWEVPPMNSYA